MATKEELEKSQAYHYRLISAAKGYFPVEMAALQTLIIIEEEKRKLDGN